MRGFTIQEGGRILNVVPVRNVKIKLAKKITMRKTSCTVAKVMQSLSILTPNKVYNRKLLVGAYIPL